MVQDSIKEKNELEEFFERGVSRLVDPKGLFRSKLLKFLENRPAADRPTVKFGVDPTSPDIHLGHAVILRKLRRLQDWGARVVFVVGDFTALIGDPSGRTRARPELEPAQIERNLKSYLDQAGKILLSDPAVFSWIKNSDWFTSVTDLSLPPGSRVTLSLKQNDRELKLDIPPNSFIGKAAAFEQSRMQLKIGRPAAGAATVTLKSFFQTLRRLTLAQLLERDMFQERLKAGRELYLHELLYPALQGIDSLVVAQIFGSCDLEIGGSDQLFNMLFGREVMKINGQRPQAVLALQLLEGLNGLEKMSKSAGNYIGLNDPAEEMFGKIMSLPDSLIIGYFTLSGFSPLREVKELERRLKRRQVNPRDLKLRLAEEIVAGYRGPAEAAAARENFLEVFSRRGLPRNLPQATAERGQKLSDLLVTQEKIVASKNEFRRLLAEGALRNLSTGEKISQPDFPIAKSFILKIGKKKFLKISVF